MLKSVEIDDLKIGMYVNQVSQQQGDIRIKSKGLVKTEQMIALLRAKGVTQLEVDLSKSRLEVVEETLEEVASPKEPQRSEHEQFDSAHNLYQNAKDIQRNFLENIKTGQPADLTELQNLSADIIDLVFENPNAISCLTLFKEANDYLLEHALNCSILLAMFARSQGFDKQLIEELSLAGLLMDVGMISMPQDILQKDGSLNKQEFDIIRTHVDIGVELIEQSGEVSDLILDICSNHHEKIDGSGYPAGKSGDEISVFARMAAIVDCYDALTSNRPYRNAMAPTSALKHLMAKETGKLDQTLVQQFIRCLGVHPVGSLVKLSSQKLAIVVSANQQDPLSPRVMTFYSLTAGTYSESKFVDLSKVDTEIEACIRPEEFGINLKRFFREVFVSSMSME